MATFGDVLQHARQLYGAGDLAGAEGVYRQLIGAVPQAAEPWFELGTLQLQTDRISEGIECLRRAVTLAPNVAAYHAYLGVGYNIHKQPAEAIASFERALQLGPATVELLNNYALSLKAVGRTDSALRAFDEALRMQEAYVNGHFNRGNLLAELRRWEEAAASFQRVIELRPDEAAAYRQLGLVLCKLSRSKRLEFDGAGCETIREAVATKQRQLGRAVDCFRHVLLLKPDDLETRGSLHAVLVAQSNLEEAVEGCQLGVALIAQGQLERAVECLQSVAALKPDFFETHYQLGVAWAHQQQWDAAIVACRQAIAFDPGDLAATNLLAVALIAANRPGEAVGWLQDLLARVPGFAAARQNLEVATERLGRLPAATAAERRTWRLRNLQAAERRVHSQNGEDGVIESLFAELGTTNRFFVEFGCGDGSECNGAYLVEHGWSGLQMDGRAPSGHAAHTIHQEFITAENINDLFRKYGVPTEFDLLSLDIDGNDFWVWQKIAARARIVVIEYNSTIPVDQRLSIAYEPTFTWSGTDYSGASLRALQELGQRKGYTLIYCERAGVNAFFVANELLPEGFQPLPIEEIYRLPNAGYWGIRSPRDPQRTMIDPLAGA